MRDASAPAIRVRDVQKDYRALRPLRVRDLDLREGESIALLGFDHGAAEVFVNLLTAATVPDVGCIEIFGRPTVDIQDADTWLSSLDCFGIVSERQVVIDNMTVEENLTMPLTMALHDVDSVVRAKVAALAEEVGLASDQLRQPVTALGAGGRLRVRLGRALAPDPRILLSEHPNASLEADDLPLFAAEYARLVARRGLTSIVLTADHAFAAAAAQRILTLQPATGELKPLSAWRRLLTIPRF
jgi:predicted ABC-type transport system involved in lysophospholipase L1 biosynthesis ATPase subunit